MSQRKTPDCDRGLEGNTNRVSGKTIIPQARTSDKFRTAYELASAVVSALARPASISGA